MSEPIVASRRSRFAVLALGIAAFILALPLSAHADGKNNGKRHGNHSRSYYQSGDYYQNDDRHYGPPPAYYYGGPPPWRGPKRVKVYNHYYPVPVPVAVPVYPAYPVYPQHYPAYDSKPVIRIGFDWVFGF